MRLDQFFLRRPEGQSVLFLSLFALLIILLVLSPFLLPPRWENVSVTYQSTPQGLVVREEYLINPALSEYHVFYRSFRPVLCVSRVCPIQLLNVTCEQGTAYYTLPDKYDAYDPRTHTPLSFSSAVHVEPNEVGCARDEGYKGIPEERLTVTYRFPASLFPNVSWHAVWDEDHFFVKHLSVKNEHARAETRFILPWEHVSVSPSTLSIKRQEAYLLLPLVLPLLPLILFLSWYFFGREKDVPMPTYLHTIPNPNREPYEAGLIARGTANEDDLATSALLELVLDGSIKMEKGASSSKPKIILLKPPERVSTFAKRLYTFLDTFAFETTDGKRVYSLFPSSMLRPAMWRKIIDLPLAKKKREFFSSTGHVIASGAVLVTGGIIYLLLRKTFFSFKSLPDVLLLSGFVLYIFVFLPVFFSIGSMVFTRYRPALIRERNAWRAFAAFLRDLVKMPQALPEDYVRWKEWLLYGAALGEAESVLKALKARQLISSAVYDTLSFTVGMGGMLTMSGAGGSSSGGGVGGGGGGGR